jgi:iron complex outermembrane receptor protein
MTRFTRILLAPLVMGIAAGTAPAFAQTSAPDAQVDPQLERGTQEIVVTARRREERLQDVPLAVTALTSDSLVEANIVTVADLPQKVPGLTIQPSAFGSNVLQVAIRGQRQFDPYITKDPAVAVYFADVVQNRPQGLNSAFFDVASVQVLKGPQGTLFGRNTTGGAMLITPQAPTDQFEGYVVGGYGNYDAWRLEGAVNVPLADWAKLRVAGSLQRRDGFTNNVTTGQKLDDEHKDNWRVSLTLSPADGIENRTVVSGFRADENGIGYKLLGRLPGIGFGSAPNVVAELDRVNALPFHSTTSDLVLKTKIKTFSVSNVTEIDLAQGVTLKNIAGYRFVSSSIPFDLDGSSLTFTDGAGSVIPYFPSREDMTVRQYSDELQLLGTIFGGSLDYILGGFYFLERGSDRQQTGGQGGVSAGGIYQGDRVTFADPVRNQSYSAFAQFTWRPSFAPGLSFTAGGRQTHDLRQLTTRNIVSNGSCRLVDGAGVPLNPCLTSYSKSYDKFTYSLTADYKIARGVLVYLAHRTGYRTGGFNISATTPVQFTPFLPEDVTDYEIGMKTDFRMGTGRGRLNIAAYTQDYRNIQRNQGSLINGVFTQTIVNAAEATIKGFEVELQLQPVDLIDFGVNIAHVDAAYRRWIANGVDLSGSQFAGTPEWTIGANFGLRIPLGNAGELAPRVDLYHQTKTNMSDNNWVTAQQRVSPTSIMRDYTLVNARVDLRDIGGSRISASLWAKNLLNAEYIASGTELANTGLGYTAGFVGAPRTYGFEVRFEF